MTHIPQASDGITPPPTSFKDWTMAGDSFGWGRHDVFFRKMGQGPLLLLLHGFPTSSHDWCWITEELSNHFTLVIPDLMDMGQSRNRSGKRVSILDQAAMVSDLMGHMDGPGFHILSHDVGDTVAQELLARQLEGRNSKRILTATFLNGGMHPDFHQPPPFLTKLAGPMGRLMVLFIKKTRILDAFAKTFDPKTRPAGDMLTDFWPSIRGLGGRPSLARRVGYLSERRRNVGRWLGALKGSTIPQRLIFGMSDPISGRHMYDGLVRLIPKLDGTRLENIGHYPHIEAPSAVVEAFLQFQNITKD